MRVLAVTNALPGAGESTTTTGIFFKEQLESLERAGVDLTIVHADRVRRGRRAYLDVGRQVRAALDASDVDLVHVLYGGVMSWAVARVVRQLPLVVSFCGNDLLGEGERRTFRWLVERGAIASSRRAARAAAGIVVKSDALRRALPADVDPARVFVLPNGVDLTLFTPRDRLACRAELGWSPERRHVLFPAAADRSEKRFWLASAAVEELRGRVADDVELHLLDGVPRASVPTWLNASDVVLLTSTHEGSPNTVKEALACDVPVVSVDVGDVAERIAGVEGCGIGEASPAALATELQRALAAGRVEGRRAVAGLSLERVAERLRDVYASVLEAGRPVEPAAPARAAS